MHSTRVAGPELGPRSVRFQSPGLSPALRGGWSFPTRGSHPDSGPSVGLSAPSAAGPHDMRAWVAVGPWLWAPTSPSCCLSTNMVWKGLSHAGQMPALDFSSSAGPWGVAVGVCTALRTLFLLAAPAARPGPQCSPGPPHRPLDCRPQPAPPSSPGLPSVEPTPLPLSAMRLE